VKPHTTLRNVLVHPKDRIGDDSKVEVVYQIPCKTVTNLTSEKLEDLWE